MHFVISIIFGFIFAWLVSFGSMSDYAGRVSTGAILGIIYGIAVWVVGAAILMPLWMGAVTGVNPPIPNLNWVNFAGHISYGVVLAALYPMLLGHN